jgi:glycosyltransferase A (GT-A) superfamily protein (DUF2064 family)
VTARIVVMAKAPVAGRSKTRLCPPLTPDLAARVAEAALADTLAAVLTVPGGGQPVLALDGAPGPWLPPGFDVISQRGGGLDERLAAAMDDAGCPALLIGMDTPQVTPVLLRMALDQLAAPEAGAVLGLTADGGWWALGLRHSDPNVFLGLPTSTPSTGRRQLGRLEDLRLRVSWLPVQRDVDTIDDALAVARGVPGSRFAAAVRSSLRHVRELESVA